MWKSAKSCDNKFTPSWTKRLLFQNLGKFSCFWCRNCLCFTLMLMLISVSFDIRFCDSQCGKYPLILMMLKSVKHMPIFNICPSWLDKYIFLEGLKIRIFEYYTHIYYIYIYKIRCFLIFSQLVKLHCYCASKKCGHILYSKLLQKNGSLLLGHIVHKLRKIWKKWVLLHCCNLDYLFPSALTMSIIIWAIPPDRILSWIACSVYI